MARSKKLSLVATALAVHVERWQWRQIIASDHGPASPTTRYVLQVLSLFMQKPGGNCFPSQSMIARRAALTTRAVKKHLAIARRDRWIDVTEHHNFGNFGQGWRRNSYAAIVPATLHPIVQRLNNGDYSALWINLKGGEPGSPMWGTSFTGLGNDVPINLVSGHETVLSAAAVDKSARKSRSTAGAAQRSKDDLKKRSAEKTGALRSRIGAATRVVPIRDAQHELTDGELAAKVRALRGVGQRDGDIRRALASQAGAAQLTRVLKAAGGDEVARRRSS